MLICLLSAAPCSFPAQSSGAIIQSISFEGNKSFTAAQLKRYFSRSREGIPYSPENLRADLTRAVHFYHEQGFIKAKAGQPDVQIRSVAGESVASIRIAIEEGPLHQTGNIAVKNARAIDSQGLIQLCPLQKGRPYNRRSVAEWQAKTEEAYRSMGYIKARALIRENVNPDNTVDCTLECVEGRVYTVGKIVLTGTGVSPADFKRRLLVGEGAVFNPEMLSSSIHFLNQAKIYEPLSGADVEIKLNDELGTVDLFFRVNATGRPKTF